MTAPTAPHPLLAEFQALVERKHTTGLSDAETARLAAVDRLLDEADAAQAGGPPTFAQAVAMGRDLALIFTDAQDGTRQATPVEVQVDAVLERDATGRPRTVRWHCGHKLPVYSFQAVLLQRWEEEGVPGPELRACPACQGKGVPHASVFARLVEARRRQAVQRFMATYGGRRIRRRP